MFHIAIAQKSPMGRGETGRQERDRMRPILIVVTDMYRFFIDATGAPFLFHSLSVFVAQPL